jgi:hypothetical protein
MIYTVENKKPLPVDYTKPHKIPAIRRDPKVKDTHRRLHRFIEKRWSDEELKLWGFYRPVDQRIEVDEKTTILIDEETVYDEENDQVVIRYITEPRNVRGNEVNKERDRRIHAGFEFAGKIIQSDPLSASRIMNYASLAREAISVDGIKPKETKWVEPDEDFTWITADNSEIVISAQDMLRMAKACMKHESRMIKKAKKIKRESPIPYDYDDDSRWGDE